jgi:4a-hydroxytetrahydrobiopterin dehydratase
VPPIPQKLRKFSIVRCRCFPRSRRQETGAQRHHPNISFGWGNATVSLQTKKIKGLHENDFIVATKIDRIFARTAAG